MSSPNQTPLPYRHWSDVQWDELDIRPSISARLAKIDRALHGMGVVQELLAMSFDASQTEEEEISKGLCRLTPNQQEGLNAAALTLFHTASDAMTALRDNERDCWGLKA